MDPISTNDVITPQNDANGTVCLERLERDHVREREGLVLTKRPYATLKFFTLAVLQYVWQSALYVARHSHGLLFLCIGFFLCTMLITLDGPHEQLVKEALVYFRYALWWVGLGVASSIGLGSGLHTFVLYLGPHIAMFTIQATLCGRVDLKSAKYDTAIFGMAPTWALKKCSEFGKPLYPKIPDSESYKVPLLAILHEVHWEAILWGIGTAVGELPPYFISRAERLSGQRLKQLDDLSLSDVSDSGFSNFLSQIKIWILTHFQHFNFWTILIFASVPNPLFDFAGVICGQLLVPLWRFFIPTLIGKAIIKTHLQTVFVILLFNNQLVELLDSGLRWIFPHIPAISRVLPYILSHVNNVKATYDSEQAPMDKVHPWKFSFSFIWNTVVWIMLIGFLNSIVNKTALRFLMEKQKKEIEYLKEKENERSNSKQD